MPAVSHSLSLPDRSLAAAVARFLAIGLTGLGIDAALFNLLAAGGAADALARALSLVAATLATWQLNRAFTFAASHRRLWDESLRYGLVAFGSQGFSYALFLALRAGAPELPANAALLAGAALAAIISFAGHRSVSFRPARLVLS